MKTLNVVVLVALFVCLPLVMLLAADTPPARSTEKPTLKTLKDMTVEELLNRLGTGPPDQTEAFDMFLMKFKPLCPQIDKYCISYRGYGFQEGLMLNFEPLPYPGLVVVPLGPAIMAQMGLKGGVLVQDISGDMLKLGLEKYDIVTGLNGAEVADTGGFYKILSNCPTDKEVQFDIIRGGKPLPLKIKLWSPPFGARNPD
jgi:hypothetical protein